MYFCICVACMTYTQNYGGFKSNMSELVWVVSSCSVFSSKIIQKKDSKKSSSRECIWELCVFARCMFGKLVFPRKNHIDSVICVTWGRTEEILVYSQDMFGWDVSNGSGNNLLVFGADLKHQLDHEWFSCSMGVWPTTFLICKHSKECNQKLK